MPFAKLEDDLEMFYDVDDFTDPWKSPETIVLHHGMGKNTRMWYAWVPTLARHYRVVRLDARGFGQSTVPPPGYDWSLPGFARDVKNLLDYLDLDKVHMVGETLGGTICMQFAADYPERTQSLTICSSPFRFISPIYAEHGEEIARDGMMSFARKGMARRLDANADPAFVEWYANEMGKTSTRVGYEVLRSQPGVDLSDTLPKIKAPTLIMTAANFFLYPPGETQEMQRLIPNAQIKLFEGVSGFAHYAYPEKCAAALLEFLRSLK
ncbi:MAG: alpha/beta fold hydrolase [Chloroflexi bacterium]|nr:alpha/beta fold hydrolase [Chloroflexota bacterium]